MKKLIIINQEQFGYNNATFYYCKYLKKNYDIVYICWDHGLEKINMDYVRVVYVNRTGNVLSRTARFVRTVLKESVSNKTIIFIKYFKGVSLALRFLRPKSLSILDIRTGSVEKKNAARRLQDACLKFETLFYKNITVISCSLAEKMGISEKAHILPLGADVISNNVKTFKNINLLYVGTLFNRNLETTIDGFKIFCEKIRDDASVSYIIIGSGPNNEELDLKIQVAKYKLEKLVNVVGSIPHDKLQVWFDKSNIGVSYVPITDYYDCQPVTKTFEYFLSGMPVLATSTAENKRVILPANGVLVGDTADDFCSGLEKMYAERNNFDSIKIRNDSETFTWQKIVKENLKPYLQSLY